MPSNSLVFRFIGIDDGAGAQFDRLSAKADTTNASFKKFGIGAAVALGIVAAASLDLASKFQASTEMIHTQTGASQAQIDSWRKAILAMAGEVGTAPDDLSQALFHLASTGQRGAAAIRELGIAAEGAKVGGADLVDVTNALNATIVSGISGSRNFSSAMGALNAIVGAGDMHMQDLADALGTGVLPIVKAFGVGLVGAGAALATFGDNNIRGAKAGTQLRMAIQAMAEPIDTGASALQQLGLTTNSLAKDMQTGGLNKAITDLHDHLVDAGDAGDKMGKILVDAFGKRAGTGLAVLEEEFGRFELKIAEVQEGSKNFGSDWTATTQTLDFQFSRFRADVDVLAISFGDHLLPAALDTLRALEESGDAAKATAQFFMEHKVATLAVAGALTGALLPALIKTGFAMAADTWETFALTMMYAKDAIVGFALGADEAAAADVTFQASLGPIAAVLAAFGAVAAITWEHSREQTQKATAAANEYIESLHVSTNSVSSLQSGISQLTVKLTPLNNQLMADAKAGHVLAEGALIAKSGYATLVGQLQTYQQQQKTVSFNEGKIAQAYGITRQQVEQLANANGIDLTGSLQSVDDGFKQLTTAATLSKSPLKDANANFADMAQSTTTAAQAVTDLGNSFDDLVGNFVGMKQAQIDFKNDLVATVAALKKSHDSITLNSKDSRDAATAYYALVDQIETVTSATYTSSKSYDAAKASAKNMLDALEQLPVKGPAVQKVIHGLERDIAGMGAAAEGIGKNVDLGLVAGMQAYASKVTGQAKVVANAAIVAMEHESQVASPSLRTAYIGRMLAEGLIQGWTGEASRIKDVLGTTVEDALDTLDTKVKNALTKQQDALKTAESTLKSELATRASDIKSLASTIDQGAQVSGIFGTDANGNPTVANLGQFLGAQIGPLKTFATDLALLHKKGLNNNLLNQIANLGPTEGIQVAEQILSGQDSIKQLNAAQAEITRYSDSASSTVTDSLLKHTIEKDRASVDENSKALRDLTRRLDKLLHRAANATALNVTISKGGSLKLTREDAREILRAIREYRDHVNPKVLD